MHKRSAVIRFMFFHREDINWFKPIELRTKYGRRGHIKEALGTHGHMKCVFNGQLKSEDTILMNLYKRVFPKWTYEPFLLTESEHEDQKPLLDDWLEELETVIRAQENLVKPYQLRSLMQYLK
ncbi:Pre-rRNA-processing protein TSR1 homolog [Anthophora plagiata]